MLFANCNIEVKDKKLMRPEKRRKRKREWEGVKGAEERGKNEGMQKRGREGGREKGRDELEGGRRERRKRVRREKERQADKDCHP